MFLRHGESGGEYTLLRCDGTTVDVEFQATANVVPGRHLSVLRDITARKRAERDPHRVNQRLREARDRETSIAVALQQSLLPSVAAIDGIHVAARYIPAAQGVRVCGDWYDVTDLGDERIGVAVGDVAGHGVQAAGLMGQLSSALSAEIRSKRPPAEALAIVDEYAASLGEDLLATVFHALVDRRQHTITFSNAGHPPPLVHHDGQTCFLSQALAPPLAAAVASRGRPQETVELPAGSVLVLYTDGLVERRQADIDDGLAELQRAVQRHARLPADDLAQAILDDRLVDGAADDDVALVVITL